MQGRTMGVDGGAEAGRGRGERRRARRGWAGSTGSVLVAAASLLIALAPVTAAAQRTIEVPDAPRLLDVAAEPLFSVGRIDGPDHEVFGEVTGVAFGPDGSLHVLDRVNFRVVVFGPDGSFRHRFGRQGGGPSEFSLPSGIAVDPAGNVWVGDALGRSLKVFGPDGELVQTIPSGAVGRPDFGTLTAADAGSAVLLERVRNAQGGMIPVYRVGVEEGFQEVARVPVPFVPQTRQTAENTFRLLSAPVFTAPTRVVALPDRSFARLTGPAYSVDVIGAAGVEARIVSGLEPAAVTVEHHEQEKERRRERNRELRENPPPAIGGFQMLGSSEERLEESLARLDFAEEHAVIRALAADPAGRLWIQRWDGSPWGPAPVDLVSVEGGYLGTLPAREMPDAVGPDGLVAYVGEDDLGVQRVEVARLAGLRSR